MQALPFVISLLVSQGDGCIFIYYKHSSRLKLFVGSADDLFLTRARLDLMNDGLLTTAELQDSILHQLNDLAVCIN
jgi:hypothetical protein